MSWGKLTKIQPVLPALCFLLKLRGPFLELQRSQRPSSQEAFIHCLHPERERPP